MQPVAQYLGLSNSIFANNFRYLSWKYGLNRSDWCRPTDLDYLLVEVKMRSTKIPLCPPDINNIR